MTNAISTTSSYKISQSNTSKGKKITRAQKELVSCDEILKAEFAPVSDSYENPNNYSMY